MVESTNDVLHHIEVELLSSSVTNPRKKSANESVVELSASISEMGIIGPLPVRPHKGGFEIVCGARRYKASCSIGMKTLPCYVRNIEDNEVVVLQISENLDRVGVHPLQ